MDLATGAVVGVTVQGSAYGGRRPMTEMLPRTAEILERLAETSIGDGSMKELVSDTGYQSMEPLCDLREMGIRTCGIISKLLLK